MGRVDLFHSRRTKYAKCEFWVRDEKDSVASASKWVLQNKPSGTFWARPLSAKTNSMNVINNAWAIDSDHVTLETDDEVNDIRRGCVVKYADEVWIVDSVQRVTHWKESEFSKHMDYLHILELRKG